MVRVGIGEGAAGTVWGGCGRDAKGNRESGGPPWDAESDLKEGRK